MCPEGLAFEEMTSPKSVTDSEWNKRYIDWKLERPKNNLWQFLSIPLWNKIHGVKWLVFCFFRCGLYLPVYLICIQSTWISTNLQSAFSIQPYSLPFYNLYIVIAPGKLVFGFIYSLTISNDLNIIKYCKIRYNSYRSQFSLSSMLFWAELWTDMVAVSLLM